MFLHNLFWNKVQQTQVFDGVAPRTYHPYMRRKAKGRRNGAPFPPPSLPYPFQALGKLTVFKFAFTPDAADTS